MQPDSELPLYPRRSSLRERPYLIDGRHGRVTGEGRDEGTMSPPEPHGLFGRFAGQQSIDQAGGEAVTTADAIVDIDIARRRHECVAIDPGNRAPGVTARRVHL